MSSTQGKALKARTYHTKEGYAALTIAAYPLLLLYFYFPIYDIVHDFMLEPAPFSIYRVADFFYNMQYNWSTGLLSLLATLFVILISAARLNRLGKKGTKLGWIGSAIFFAAMAVLIVGNILYYSIYGETSADTFIDTLSMIAVALYLLSIVFSVGISLYALFSKPKKLDGETEEEGADDPKTVTKAEPQGPKLSVPAYLVYILPSLLFSIGMLYGVINPFYGILGIDAMDIAEMLSPFLLIALYSLNYYTLKLIMSRGAKDSEVSKDFGLFKAMTTNLFQFKGKADNKEFVVVSLYSLLSFASFFLVMNVLYPSFVFLVTNRPFVDIIMSYSDEGYESVGQYFIVGLVLIQLLWSTIALVSTAVRRTNSIKH